MKLSYTLISNFILKEVSWMWVIFYILIRYRLLTYWYYKHNGIIGDLEIYNEPNSLI